MQEEVAPISYRLPRYTQKLGIRYESFIQHSSLILLYLSLLPYHCSSIVIYNIANYEICNYNQMRNKRFPNLSVTLRFGLQLATSNQPTILIISTQLQLQFSAVLPCLGWTVVQHFAAACCLACFLVFINLLIEVVIVKTKNYQQVFFKQFFFFNL